MLATGVRRTNLNPPRSRFLWADLAKQSIWLASFPSPVLSCPPLKPLPGHSVCFLAEVVVPGVGPRADRVTIDATTLRVIQLEVSVFHAPHPSTPTRRCQGTSTQSPTFR